MNYFTTNTYQIKRKILKKSEQKLIADINYGLLASKIFLLADITDQLHEPITKINTVEQLSKQLFVTIFLSSKHFALLIQ